MDKDDALVNLIMAAKSYMDATLDQMENFPGFNCKQDPCPYCSAGNDLQLALADAEDTLDLKTLDTLARGEN